MRTMADIMRGRRARIGLALVLLAASALLSLLAGGIANAATLAA